MICFLIEYFKYFQLIDKAREYFGLSDLEKPTQAGGILNVHIGDALSPSVNIFGGYAGEFLVYMSLYYLAHLWNAWMVKFKDLFL